MLAHHRLEQLRGLDRRRRALTVLAWWGAALLVAAAVATLDWRLGAAVGACVASIATFRSWRLGLGVSALAARSDAESGDGLVATACAVERGDSTGDAALGGVVIARAIARLDAQGTTSVPPARWPWGAAVVAVAAVAFVAAAPPLPDAPATGSVSLAGDLPGPVRRWLSPVTSSLAEVTWLPWSSRRGEVRAASGGEAQAAGDPGQQSGRGEGVGTSGAPVAPDGAGQEGGAPGSLGLQAAGPSSMVAPVSADLLRGVGLMTSGEHSWALPSGLRTKRPPSSDIDSEAFTVAGVGTSPDEEGGQLPRSVAAGPSSGRMADQTEDLDDFDIDHAAAGAPKEDAARETNSGRAGAMGSNDAPGTDDTQQQALADAEMAEEWVEARLRSSPLGVLREVETGRTGQRSSGSYQQLTLNYAAIAEGALTDPELSSARRDLVRAYFDALQEN